MFAVVKFFCQGRCVSSATTQLMTKITYFICFLCDVRYGDPEACLLGRYTAADDTIRDSPLFRKVMQPCCQTADHVIMEGCLQFDCFCTGITRSAFASLAAHWNRTDGGGTAINAPIFSAGISFHVKIKVPPKPHPQDSFPARGWILIRNDINQSSKL